MWWYLSHYVLGTIVSLLGIATFVIGLELFTAISFGESKVRLYRRVFGIYFMLLGIMTFVISLWVFVLTVMGIH